jgi:hypothetical protein
MTSAFNFGVDSQHFTYQHPTSRTEILASGQGYRHERHDFVPLHFGEAGFGYFLFKEKVTDASAL